MALETLNGIKEIGGFGIDRFPDVNSENFIVLYEESNAIGFKIQKGPIKEVGVNGCQVDTIIETCFFIIKGLDEKFPCVENKDVMNFLSASLTRLQMRKANREARNVEGTNQL